MSRIVRGQTKEEVVESTARDILFRIFTKHQEVAERMTSGETWQSWVVMTSEEMSRLRSEENFSNKQLNSFLQQTTRLYANSWLNAMGL